MWRLRLEGATFAPCLVYMDSLINILILILECLASQTYERRGTCGSFIPLLKRGIAMVASLHFIGSLYNTSFLPWERTSLISIILWHK